jgi:uncharacterized protein YndB with AHSA1/START domain
LDVNVCPSAVVEAPVERVWALMTSPEGFDTWTDASLVAAEPEGPARPGQRLRLATSAFGHRFGMTIDVLEVDAQRHLLRLRVYFPFGLVEDQTTTMTPAGDGRTLVRFG